MSRIAVVLAVSLFLMAPSATAQPRLDGWFIALDACEAYQSKNKLTNPGEVLLTRRTAYDMIARNKPGGDWYQVRVTGAPVTEARWVSIRCGVHVTAVGPAPMPDLGGADPLEPVAGIEATDLLLALSWQPAFCEKKPTKTECRQLNDGLLPVTETQLSIHGLWPQPNGTFYCGVPKSVVKLDKDRQWDRLPAPKLDADTAERLAVAMPGTASFLDRHQWIKHGTCFFGDRGGDEYFDDTLRVTDAINGSAVGRLLAANVGGLVTGAEIRAAFDDAFGAGAGERVQIQCSGDGRRILIQELRIAMRGEITEDKDIGALIRAGDPQSMGCTSGIVDPTGLQ